MNYFLPFLAVVLGFSIVAFFKADNQKFTKLLLAFSGAFLLALTIFVLIPEVYHHHDDGHHHDLKRVGIFVVFGILLQIILEFFSHGAEHGHTHSHAKSTTFPLLLFISLSIHSILEGFPLSHGHNHSLVYGIFVHKLPISIVLTTFFINSGVSKLKTGLFILLFSLMTPFGTFLSEYVPSLAHYHVELSALVIGIFLHISTVILFESSENHKFNLYKFGSILLGFVIAYFT